MNENCAVYKTMDSISKKWTLLILLELYKGGKDKKRYSEIKDKMEDITPKVLSERLKELEKEGLIGRRVDISQFPVKTEYWLTDSGIDFIPIINHMKSWAIKWKPHNKLCESVDCKNCTL
ncbi:MAG: helix-turn-helix domain-containing protein [Thermoplasmatota archaeon]